MKTDEKYTKNNRRRRKKKLFSTSDEKNRERKVFKKTRINEIRR